LSSFIDDLSTISNRRTAAGGLAGFSPRLQTFYVTALEFFADIENTYIFARQ